MAKVELTLEELKERKVRRSNGWTRFWAIVLAFVLVAGVTGVAYKQADTKNAEIEEQLSEIDEQAAAQQSFDGAATDNNSATPNGGADANAPASDEAAEAVKAINAATAAAASGAGYKWERTSKYTKDVDVGSATDVLNGVIQGVDKNANVNSVVGGFIGIGEKSADIAKGADAAEAIGYHGGSYKLKATQLQAGDLQNLKVDGDTYTFTLANANTPKKDGSTSINRLTDDIVTQEEVAEEIKNQVGSAITVTSLIGEYSNINVKAVITDGKLVELTYSYDANVTELGLKVAIVNVKGTGAMHTEATYSNFVY